MGIAAPHKKRTPPDSCNQEASLHKSCVLEAGLEPAQPQWPRDFKSLVSTDSTIRASIGAENETRTRDPNLGKVVLYQLSYFRKLCPKKDGCKDKQFPLDGQTFQTHFFYHDKLNDPAGLSRPAPSWRS